MTKSFEGRLGKYIVGDRDAINDKSTDFLIKESLKHMDKQNRLHKAVEMTGITGGEDELREIMNSKGELHIMDRGMLSIHLLGFSTEARQG